MNKRRIELTITEYENLEELDAHQQNLIREAIAATSRSYAPYSHFSVGAAVLLEDGTIVTGTNQENAAFPSGICAERTALFYANSQHPKKAVTALAVAASNLQKLTEQPISPCGACRQVMLECEQRYHHPIQVLLYGKKRIYCIEQAQSLLPLSFTEENMK